jgi:hypothetical protein
MIVETAIKAPADLKLRTDRVGEQLSYLSDAREGETLDFVYRKQYGEQNVRRVLVVKVNDEGIEGLDETRDGEWRRFLNDKAESIDIIEPFVEQNDENEGPSNEVFVRFDEALERLGQSLDGDTLANLYLAHAATEGESARYDAVRGGVVVTLPQPKNEILKVERNSSVTFKNTKGETFVQYLYDDGTVGVYDREGGVDNVNVKAEQLAQLLSAFMARR